MPSSDPIRTEIALQKLVAAYVVTGLLFLLLPGTFLGVWNLVAISAQHTSGTLSPAWLQAHGQAQIFGWVGTFIIGIGYYSLSKMGGLMPFGVSRGWISWVLWASGAALRWVAGVTGFRWRLLLPVSAALELIAFAIFFATVSRHKPASGTAVRKPIDAWMKLVIASTVLFLLVLVVNQVEAIVLAISAALPEIPHWLDQRFLFLAGWGFPVLAIWGFNAKWLPVFLGLPQPSRRKLTGAMWVLLAALAAAAAGEFRIATVLLLFACIGAASGLHVFQRPVRPPKTIGVSASFPLFIRISYAWLLAAAVLGIFAAAGDHHGGIWGASRHALTVGYIATMIFGIGQRVLPAFCGMRILYSKTLMGISLAVLNAGCLLRVASEVPAYEANLRAAWTVLPISAIAELTAVTVFALNMAITLVLPPPVPARRDLSH